MPSVAALPLDFAGKLRLLRTMHIPAALHGAEASTVSLDSLRKLRTAFVQSVWSDGLHLADPWAVLSLLDGSVGCDPGYHVVWSRFRLLRSHMAYNSEFMTWLEFWVCSWPWSVVPLAMVRCILWFHVLPLLDLFGFQILVAGKGLVCMLFVNFLLLFSFFKTAVWEAWKTKVSLDLSARAGFRGYRLLDFRGSMKLFNFFPPGRKS